MLTDVAAVVFDGAEPFELGIVCEAFGVDRTEDGVPPIAFDVCAPTPGRVTTSMSFALDVERGLERLGSADLVVVPPPGKTQVAPPAVLDALVAAHERGARILSVCSGAFTLGAAGLLDGLECTTHWMHTADLAARYPLARVVPEVLYVDAGQVVTSAGSAAGIDACLHVWRQEHGATVAAKVARRMVVAPQRDGGQAQFIERAVPDCDVETLGPLLTWIVDHLDEPLDVDSLARHASMSPRTFARRFRAETGATPHAWVTGQRVLRAEALLEQTDRPVERVATEVGFGNAAALRHHFTRARGVGPQQYRRTFAS